MAEKPKTGLSKIIYIVTGMSIAGIISVVLFGTSDPKKGGEEAAKGLVEAIINSGTFGIVALIALIGMAIFAYLAWTAKQEQIQFMQKLIDSSEKEDEATKETLKAQNELFKTLADKLNDIPSQIGTGGKKILKRIDALALSNKDVDKESYYTKRDE